MNSRRQVLRGGLLGALGAVISPLLGGREAAASVAAPAAQAEGFHRVGLLEDITSNAKEGLAGEWALDIVGATAYVDKDEASAYVNIDGVWYPVDTVTQSGERHVVWYDDRPQHQRGTPYGRNEQPGRIWADEAETALFAS